MDKRLIIGAFVLIIIFKITERIKYYNKKSKEEKEKEKLAQKKEKTPEEYEELGVDVKQADEEKKEFLNALNETDNEKKRRSKGNKSNEENINQRLEMIFRDIGLELVMGKVFDKIENKYSSLELLEERKKAIKKIKEAKNNLKKKMGGLPPNSEEYEKIKGQIDDLNEIEKHLNPDRLLGVSSEETKIGLNETDIEIKIIDDGPLGKLESLSDLDNAIKNADKTLKLNDIDIDMDKFVGNFKEFVTNDVKEFVEISKKNGFDKVELNKMQKRINEGTQLIVDMYTGGLTKTGTKVVSKSTTKGASKLAAAVGGTMGVGIAIAAAVDTMGQLMSTGTVDEEALKQVLKEEAIALGIEIAIVGSIAAGTAVATGASMASAFSATAAGPVGAVLALGAIGGAALDMSPVGKKFASVLLNKDLYEMKVNYDKGYDIPYFNYSTTERKYREKVNNWAGGKDTIIEANFLEKNEAGKSSETKTKEFWGIVKEYLDDNNMVMSVDAIDVLVDLQLEMMAEKKYIRNINTVIYKDNLRKLKNTKQSIEISLKKLEIAKEKEEVIEKNQELLDKGMYNIGHKAAAIKILRNRGFTEEQIKEKLNLK